MTDKERLEKAIKWLGEFDHEEDWNSKNHIAYALVDEYVEFLIKQAKRVDDLEKENENLNEGINTAKAMLYDYKQALEYALYFVRFSRHEPDKALILERNLVKVLAGDNT
ncbi:hypothetical protein ACW2QC_09245 [Virgibacillus sp. FSP13]